MGMVKKKSKKATSNYVSPVSPPPCQALAFLEPLAPEDPTLGGKTSSDFSNLISISFEDDSLTPYPTARNAAEIAIVDGCWVSLLCRITILE